MIWLIGTRSCNESCGSSVVIYAVATNEVDALQLFDEMKSKVPIYGTEEDYQLWEVSPNTMLKNWIG